jgi:hypothetical protein
MPAKLTYNDVRKAFLSKGYTLVSQEYINSTSPLTYFCNNGHQHKRTYKYFTREMPCLECQKEGTKKKHEDMKNEKALQPKKTTKGIARKFNLEFVKKYMEDQGCKLLSDTYTTDRVKLKFVCICGREAEQSFNRFLHSDNRCNNKDCISKRMETSLKKNYGVANPMYSDIVKEKLAKTNIQRYGVKNVFANEDIKTKIRDSNKRKYGVEYAAKSTEVKEKIKKRNLERYGVAWPGQRYDVQQKIQAHFIQKYGTRCPINHPEIQEKIKRECFDKYGVEYHAKRDDVRAKRKKTTYDKYGVESTLSLPEFHSHGNPFIKRKIEKTMTSRYGVTHAIQSPLLKSKMDTTNLLRYGSIYPTQNAEIAQKALHNSMKSKSFQLPSGKMVKIQGYEDIVLEKLLRKYDENDILIQRTEMPELWYIDDNGKYHRYFPDFYIPSKNLVIEVKSIYTYKQDTITYHKKRKACLYAGFCFENYMYKSRIHDRVHMHI